MAQPPAPSPSGTTRRVTSPGADAAGPSPTRRRWPRGLKLAALFAAFAVTTLVGSYAYYRGHVRIVRAQFERELDDVAHLKLGEIRAWRAERMGDARVVYHNAFFSEALKRVLRAPGDARTTASVRRWLASYTVYGTYDGAFVYDARGLSLSEPAGAPPPADVVARAAAEVLREGQVRLVDFYAEAPAGQAHMATLVPIVDEQDGDRTVAVLALRINPAPWLYRQLLTQASTRSTRECVLVRREGRAVLFLSPTRRDAGAALHRRLSTDRTDTLSVQAALGRAGRVEGVNENGHRAIGVVRPVADGSWQLLTQVDVEELEARQHEQLWRVAALEALLLVAAASVLAALLRAQRLRAYADRAALVDTLTDREERLQMALSAAHQGLYDIDLSTDVTVVSREYAEMLGHDPTTFRENREGWIARLHPDDRADALAGIEACIAPGGHDGHRSEFRLATKSGGWRWIHSVGKVIARGPDGAALRMLGIHTDVTDRKLAELRSARMTRLYAALSECNEAIVRCGSEAELFPKVCEAAVRHGGMVMAWVGMVDDASGCVVPVASFGRGTEHIASAPISLDPAVPSGQSPTPLCIREGVAVWIDDFRNDPRTALYAPLVTTTGWLGAVALPLVRGGRAVGALTLISLSPETFDEDGRRLLTEMATDLGFALDSLDQNIQRRRAEAMQAESEQRYRILFNDGSVPTLLIDAETRAIVDANRAAVAFYGWELDAMRAMHIEDINTAGAVRVQSALNTVEPGNTGHFEFQHRLASGELRDVEVFTSRLTMADRPRMLSVVIDVTARHHAEAAAREKARLLTDAETVAHFGSLTIDARGNSTWSDGMFRLLGFERTAAQPPFEQVVARVHPDDLPRLMALNERSLAGEPLVAEFRVVWPDGQVRHLRARAEMLGDPAAGASLTATVQDVTDRKEAEASQRLQSEALSAVRNGIVITDPRANILWVNPAFTAITGYTLEESVGHTPFALLKIEAGEQMHDAVRRTLAAGGLWVSEVVTHRKDGTIYPEEVSISQVRDARGEVTHLIGVQRDLTEPKRLQQQFLQAQKMEVVGRLAGGIAHDFNNVLTVINGASEFALMECSEEHPAHADLLEIRAAVERAARLTRQLLAFSRKQRAVAAVVNVSDQVAQAGKMLRRLIGEDIELVLKTSSGAVRDNVLIDPGHFEQLLLNLVVNAHDAMPDGGTLTFDTRMIDADAAFVAQHPGLLPGPHVLLSVSDTGVGMSDEVRSHIFEPFFTTKAQGKGTGLGLATVFGIVAQANGVVWVESAPGRGATFTVCLPRAPDHQSPEAKPSDRPQRGTETILLVEDEDSLRELATRMLESSGYTVLAASGGDEALALLASHRGPLDLLFTDVVMPGMSGTSLAARVTQQRPGLRVLFASGYTGTKLGDAVLNRDEQFLPKPFTLAEVTAKVRRVLDAPPPSPA